MLRIDWGDLRPSTDEQHDVEARLARVASESGSLVLVRRRGSGYEARLRVCSQDRSTELRLYGDEIGDTVERLVELLEIVAREQQRASR